MPTIEEVRSEVDSNFQYIQMVLQNRSGCLIFVDGRLYQGPVTYDCLKGVGWHSGRPVAVDLPGVSQEAQVHLVDLNFGRLRQLKYVEPRSWEVLNLPEDT